MDLKTKIEVDDYVIVQRQGYTKLHKLKAHGTMVLGSFTVEMDNVIGMEYSATFVMKNVPGNKKLFTLEKYDEKEHTGPPLNIEKSGTDNRNIPADGALNQNLTTAEISDMKEQELKSSAIVEKLVTNSRTFGEKTEYSQEKYIKKKEKKYYEFLQIRHPSVRLLVEMFYRQDPGKIQGIRIDDLSQILSYANVQGEGVHLLYDSGSSGLMAAAIMHRIGPKTTGQLIQMFPGNICQKTAFQAMHFMPEQQERCVNVNIYSILRNFYQEREENVAESVEESEEPEAKKPKIQEDKPTWQKDNEKALPFLKMGVDSLIITAKEHPTNIVCELVQFLKPGRSLVVFSQIREPLLELYEILKCKLDFLYVRIFSSFMRDYQVLPDRTHPEVNMTSGGYILTAYKYV